MRHIWLVIRSFRHRGLKRLYESGDGSKLPPMLVPRIEEVLALLDVAVDVAEMDLPHLRLHPLSGNRKGQWAVTIRANWRLVFRFDQEPFDVDFVDYH